MTVRRHMQQLVVPLVVWGGSMAAYAATRGVAGAGLWASWLAALVTLLALGGTVALAARRGPRALRQKLDLILGVSSVPVVLLIAASGGFESPAALLPAFFVLSVAARRGLRAGAMAAAGAAVLLLGAELSAGAEVDLSLMVSVLALTSGAGLIPFWLAKRADGDVFTARQRLARVEGYLADRRLTPSGQSALASDLRLDSMVAQQSAEGIRDLEALDRYLRDVRDASGADEVIFWRWDALKSTQKPASWSTEGTTKPVYFSDEWAPFVKWAAEAELAQCVESDGIAYFIAGPVKGRGGLYGVLAMSSRAGLTLAPDGARDWLARYSTQVALMVELLEARRDSGRDRLQTKALLAAAEGFQAYTTPAELGKAICQAALDVTSGKRSALVRWDPETRTGVVQATGGTMLLPENMPVALNSFVGERCRQGLPVTKTDARTLPFNDPKLAPSNPMLGPSEAYRAIGSFSVVPMKTEGLVIGAIVVEGKEAGEVTPAEGRNLGLLGVLAANFLQAAWHIEQANRYARTDQLTGLWNRGHFDEQLKRVLQETDRFGTPCSLIVADIDFFKKINDTYGHEAGDVILKAVAKVFLDGIRTVDICARYGGEEIAVLLPQTALTGAMELAERLRKAVEAKLVYHVGAGRHIGVTASFGVASYPEAVGTHEALFPAADRALYLAKKEGRNRVKPAALYPGTKPT